MDNPSDKKNKDEIRTQDRQSPMPPADGTVVGASPQHLAMHMTNASLGAYGGNGGYQPNLSIKSLDDLKQWDKSFKGRLAIRAFSRGILGAAFFAGGSALAKRWMKGYNPELGITEQMASRNDGNPLKVVAKLIDKFIGTPLEITVGAALGKEAGRNFVHFRPTNYEQFYASKYGNPIKVSGRPLGKEAVMITFDFFSASIGDAWGRDIAGMIDPNVKKPWRDDKGNISIPETVKNVTKALFRYISYNGGEDWAVAIPYAYYMKGQRRLLNWASPGWKYDFDRGINGNSHKMGTRTGRDGKEEHHIVGNFAQEGIIDFQGRFTVYNIGTLMYREVYNYIENKLSGKVARLYGSPEDTTKRGVLGTLADFGKWVTRSVIKGGIYMTPVVPFFSITRANQRRHSGRFIHSKYGILSSEEVDENNRSEISSVSASQLGDEIQPTSQVVFSQYDEARFPHDTHWQYEPNFGRKIPSEATFHNPIPINEAGSFNANNSGTSLIGKTFDKIGQAQYKAAGLLDPAIDWSVRRLSRSREHLEDKIIGWKDLNHEFTRASISYTPYMTAKAEAAKLWDTGRMDMAIEGTIDGLTHFRFGQFKRGIGEIRDSLLHHPFSDPSREAQAKRRDFVDQSPPDVFLESEAHRHRREESEKKRLSHRYSTAVHKPVMQREQRVVLSAPPAANTDKTHVEKAGRKPAKYTDQIIEDLAKLDPPTNSRH